MVDSDGLFLGADVLNHFVQELRIAFGAGRGNHL